jgi:hypothetical protein
VVPVANFGESPAKSLLATSPMLKKLRGKATALNRSAIAPHDPSSSVNSVGSRGGGAAPPQP